jgi:hypothetical protein
MTESEWQHMCAEASEANWPEHQALIEAAYSDPVLRGLYPFTSHWTLRFSTSTRPDLTVLPTRVAAHQNDYRYTISAHYMGEVLAETTTAEEAVATVVRRLHGDPGPVTSGAL